jgi:solute carrier family 35 (adenosine 3'-phospho 5'-phosphosulfate transporter), member B3
MLRTSAAGGDDERKKFHHHDSNVVVATSELTTNTKTSTLGVLLGPLFRLWTSLSHRFETQTSSTAQFLILGIGVFVFFGIHNYLQEAIMHLPGFQSYGIMLGWFEVFGVAACSYLEGQFLLISSPNDSIHRQQRKAPMTAYPVLTALLLASSAFSNMSLNCTSFPTKAVFRSCKLISTMIVASILHKKRFSVVEYACATAVCSDWTVSGPNFHPVGLILVSASVFADAVLPNAQERLFHVYQASRLEVTYYTNIYTLAVMTLASLSSGEFLPAMSVISSSMLLQVYFGIYAMVAYVATSFDLTVVRRFGGVTAVLLATARKGMTLILSFVLIPKEFSYYYPMGATLVLGGLLVVSTLDDCAFHEAVSDPRFEPQTPEEREPFAKIKDDDDDWDLDELRLALEQSLKEQPTPAVCSVCMDTIHEADNSIRLPCFHSFHASCASDWVRINHTCPLCRFRVSSLDDCAFQGTRGTSSALEHWQYSYTQNDVDSSQGEADSTNAPSLMNPNAGNLAVDESIGANRVERQRSLFGLTESMVARAARRMRLRRRDRGR